MAGINEWDNITYIYTDGTAEPIRVENVYYDTTNQEYISSDSLPFVDNNNIVSGSSYSFQVLSPAESAFNSLSDRIKMFHQWLVEEQKDLEEECGADLSGLIDKLEETFPEISGESETEDGLDNQGNILNTEDYNRWFEQIVAEGLDVNIENGIDRGYINDGIPGPRYREALINRLI